MTDSLRLTLVAPASARLGAAVPIVLRLQNTSARPAEAHFLGRAIAFDIVVVDSTGAVVWQRLAHETGQSILQIRMLAAGEAMEWRDAWVPQAAGRYRIQGILPSDDAEPRRTEWVTLEVR